MASVYLLQVALLCIVSAGVELTGTPLQRHCFFQPDKCQVFTNSNSTGDGGEFTGVTRQQLISMWGPTEPEVMGYNGSCYIGCQACRLSANQRLGFKLYQSRQATGKVRLRVKLTRTADDSALPSYPKCGKRPIQRTDVTLVDRVAGGENVLRGEFPWQAQIRSLDTQLDIYVHTCGGVIISDRFVLTAAHCMQKALGQYEVVVGQYDLRVKEISEQVFGIKEKVDLPDYLANGTKVGDLAVLLLETSRRPAIYFSAEVRPACLIRPEDAAPADGSTCVISGWGNTLPGAKKFPFRLHGADVPIVSDDYCASREVYGSKFIPEKMVCAGFVKGGVDTCQGDSGGGLVCEAPDGSWQVVGTVATGNDVCGAIGKPGIYTELQPYYERILLIINALH